MNISPDEIRVWQSSPVTRWIVEQLEREQRKLEKKLRDNRFVSLDEVVAAQTELRSIEKWIVQPGQLLKQLLNRSTESAED